MNGVTKERTHALFRPAFEFKVGNEQLGDKKKERDNESNESHYTVYYVFERSLSFQYEFPPTTWTRAKAIITNGLEARSGNLKNRGGASGRRTRTPQHACMKLL